MIQDSLITKRKRLISILKGFDSLLVAYSGGVDSTLLLAVASETLKKNLIAITAKSPIHPSKEIQEAKVFAKGLGVYHMIMQSREMSRSDFTVNTKNRCYICKKYLFEDLLKIAYKKGIKYVAHGANVDDLEDFRPGFAAAQELGVKAPLIDAELTKNDIRTISKHMKLATWNKPQMACLATRIPYGMPITTKDLKMIDQAEQFIWSFGFTVCRVRLHGNVARIEVNSGILKKCLIKKSDRVLSEN